MSDVPSTTPPGGDNLLTKKVSGIKIQYLVIYGLIVVVAAYLWRKYHATATAAVPTSTVDTSGQAGGPTSSTNGGSGGTGYPTAPVAQTNAQWARSALNAAIGNGSVDPTNGANAVSAYLNGQALTASQAAIIATLTSAYGQPPEGVLPIILTPAATTPAATTPTATTPAATTPTPSAPVATTPKPTTASTPYPLAVGSYFGPRSGPANSVSGYYNNRANLRAWQARMASRGYTIAQDGLYGPQTAGVARAFQQQQGLAVDGLIGPQTWNAAFK